MPVAVTVGFVKLRSTGHEREAEVWAHDRTKTVVTYELTAREVPIAGLSITHTNGASVKSLHISSSVTKLRTTATISAFWSAFSSEPACTSENDGDAMK